MTAVDLRTEYLQALADPRREVALPEHDVTDPTASSICALATTETSGEFYEPHTLGRLRFVCPVFYDDELCDLISFDPHRPDKWWVRLGSEAMLGASALSDQLLGKPLHIFKTPLSWLQGGCEGVVVIDLNRAFIDLATAPHGLVGEDDSHTDELRRMMTDTAMRRLPRFLVRQQETV